MTTWLEQVHENNVCRWVAAPIFCKITWTPICNRPTMNQTLPTPAPALNYATPSTAEPPPLIKRLVSLDAYRGLVMIMMASAGLGLSTIAAQSFPNHPVWHKLGYHTD